MPPKINKLPPLDYLNECLEYNPDTGALICKVRARHHFKTEGSFKTWNKRFAGKLAGCYANGYRSIGLNRVKYYAHRLAYFMFHGVEPDYIDHYNGVRDDNRISNLVSCAHKDNMKNQSRPSSNTSGVTGVHRHKQARKWAADIYVNGKNKHLGLFTNKDEAIAARLHAEKEHGYHINHGRSATCKMKTNE